MLLFELLTGKLPFEGRSLTAKITAILTQPVPDLSQLAPSTPEALVDLVYCMLEKDQHQRIPGIRLVGAELEAILKDPYGEKPDHVSSTGYNSYGAKTYHELKILFG